MSKTNQLSNFGMANAEALADCESGVTAHKDENGTITSVVTVICNSETLPQDAQAGQYCSTPSDQTCSVTVNSVN
jgi:hypothetical protein